MDTEDDFAFRYSNSDAAWISASSWPIWYFRYSDAMATVSFSAAVLSVDFVPYKSSAVMLLVMVIISNGIWKIIASVSAHTFFPTDLSPSKIKGDPIRILMAHNASNDVLDSLSGSMYMVLGIWMGRSYLRYRDKIWRISSSGKRCSFITRIFRSSSFLPAIPSPMICWHISSKTDASTCSSSASQVSYSSSAWKITLRPVS